ncbi:MAG: hypothetical protein ACLR56_11345 [Oscillospiraceae bacterium]
MAEEGIDIDVVSRRNIYRKTAGFLWRKLFPRHNKTDGDISLNRQRRGIFRCR